jgi:hypothetical protein
MINGFENIEFVGHLSRWKLSGVLILWLCVCAIIFFSKAEDHTYYKWMFLPGMFPVRVLLAVGMLWLTVMIFWLLIMAFTNTPIIQVSKGNISLWRWKAVIYPISNITEISAISNNSYHIQVDGKKYIIPCAFFRRPDLLDVNMEKLINLVHT